MRTKALIRELEKMKFCVYCRASPEFCTCKNDIKWAIWLQPTINTIKRGDNTL